MTFCGAINGPCPRGDGSGSSTVRTMRRCSWCGFILSCWSLNSSPEAASEQVWHRRFREINDWEHYLVDNGVHVVKVCLNLSKTEQARRFLDRIDEPDKNWKFSINDIRERRHWDQYQEAFSAMLSHTSTDAAPWHVVPADHKWFARLATAAVLINTLADIDPHYPKLHPAARQEMAAAKSELLAKD